MHSWPCLCACRQLLHMAPSAVGQHCLVQRLAPKLRVLHETYLAMQHACTLFLLSTEHIVVHLQWHAVCRQRGHASGCGGLIRQMVAHLWQLSALSKCLLWHTQMTLRATRQTGCAHGAVYAVETFCFCERQCLHLFKSTFHLAWCRQGRDTRS